MNKLWIRKGIFVEDCSSFFLLYETVDHGLTVTNKYIFHCFVLDAENDNKKQFVDVKTSLQSIQSELMVVVLNVKTDVRRIVFLFVDFLDSKANEQKKIPTLANKSKSNNLFNVSVWK